VERAPWLSVVAGWVQESTRQASTYGASHGGARADHLARPAAIVVAPSGELLARTRKLAQAPRERPAVLVADLDLDQRHDWLELFPFHSTRRPDAYSPLAAGRAEGS
jgi:predicted amidohydrolase